MKNVRMNAMKNVTVKVYIVDALMQSATQPFYLPSIPIIYKSKENLDNNYKKTPQK